MKRGIALSDNQTQMQQIDCLRCRIPMHQVNIENWSSNILLKQLQKLADSLGMRVYHCKQCGKIEFFR